MSSPDSEIMSYVVRMVTPVRREFGRTLNVQRFLQDEPYAHEVISEALQSKDERLQNYAAYLQSKLLGPRTSGAPVASRSTTPPTATTPTSSVPSTPTASETEDLKAAMLAKYRIGLR